MKQLICITTLVSFVAACAQEEIYPPEYYANINVPSDGSSVSASDPHQNGLIPNTNAGAAANATGGTPAQQSNDVERYENTGISDLNDFDTIQGVETIQSDAERRAALARNLVVFDAVAVPDRGNAVNVAAYAINSKNAVGQSITDRNGKPNPDSTACRRAGTSDQAQRKFLERGGPAKDPLRLDPDGDGFACRFDPTPYRQMVRN